MLAVYQANAMRRLQWAHWFTDRGVPVFALAAGSKDTRYGTHGHLDGTLDAAVIVHWFTENPQYNLGIVPGQLPDGRYLWVLDLDTKHGRNGVRFFQDWCKAHGLDAQALAQSTLAIRTPTGGQHLYLISERPVRHGAGVMGDDSGVDTRSNGKGYVVGPGSLVGQKRYTVEHMAEEFAIAPTAFCEALGYDSSPRATAPAASTAPPPPVDQTRAAARVVDFLKTAPLAVEGSSGDQTTYQVACRVKDLGVDAETAEDLLSEHWNPRCQPPWSDEDLHTKVLNAYKYGKDPIGVAAPEVEFSPVAEDPAATLHPFENMNREWAFVMQGGAHILWETTDAHNRPIVKHVPIPAFHAKFANRKMTIGTRTKPISVHWMEAKERRSYDGVVFMPEQPAPARFFNLWSGYTCEPAAPGVSHEAVDLWMSHLLKNVCGGSATQFHWVMAYFAQLIQRPWQKPRIALVFRGAKGVGKNALIERVAALLGRHAMVTADRRYVDGNFNGHLEHCLLLVVDEAFWSGDRTIEGTLKNLITGREHIIEHKGCEPYPAQNLTRVVIMGNEEWLVPASNDERRYAVFDVGDGRKQDSPFFSRMIDGMDHGGYPVLLRTLLDVDVDLVDLDHAPLTAGLLEQKEHSLNPLEGWWAGCLQAGRIAGADWSGWPEEVDCERFRRALKQHASDRNILTRIPADNAIGRLMKKFAPGFDRTRGKEVEGGRPWVYRLPGLADARRGWDKYMGQEIIWPD